MSLFQDKNVKPMLIKSKQPAFNDANWIYELKLDGCRCIAYLDINETDLRNKRDLSLIQKFPELLDIHKSINKRCILDGELIILKNGVPDFYELQRRTLLTDPFKIRLAAAQLPASFVAYDCLLLGDREITKLPLMERKECLNSSLRLEDGKIAISRYIERNGIGLYQLVEERQLEGVVAKRKDSLYFQGKRTSDWIKFKRLTDEDFIVVGYIRKGKYLYSLILAQYMRDNLIYKGHVTSGVTAEIIHYLPVIKKCPFTLFPIKENDGAVWVQPLACTIEYMPNTKGSLREAVFKGMRMDINITDLIN